jgi:hypothetical protein
MVKNRSICLLICLIAALPQAGFFYQPPDFYGSGAVPLEFKFQTKTAKNR